MRRVINLIMVLSFLAVLLFQISCTYDYFEDETNYILYVPEVEEGSVTDCSVFVYADSGQLIAKKTMSTQTVKDPRMAQGLFGFKLFPGSYKVYCYTNTDSISFSNISKLQEAAFTAHKRKSGQDHYVQPSNIRFDKKEPVIVHTGVLSQDTTEINHYTGRVTVRFKNFPLNPSTVKVVKMSAENVGTIQYLKTDTITTSFTASDKILHEGGIPEQLKPEYLELDYRFFPSLEDKAMSMKFHFIGNDDNILMDFPVNLVENDGKPIRLLHGQRIIIEIDTYTIVKISLIGWDEDIVSGDTNME